VSVLFQPTLLGNAKPFYPVFQWHVTARLLKHMLALLLGSALLCVAILRFVTLAEAAKIVTPAISPVARTTQFATASVSPPTTPAPAAASISPPCVPFGPVHMPAALPMTAPGLQQLVDTPATYTVHGTTNGDIAAELRRCAPTSSDGIFSGATSYWLGAHYSYNLTPAATCKLTDITVAIHVSQVLPTWHDTASSELTAAWETYERHLVLHENGHTIIDIAQAQTLLDELTALPDMPCDTIGNAASTVTANRLTALDQANADYDASTGHGASQGAIW
jgi:predicted secreted Zn-dependent protease